jgi:hypothetical protein
MPDVEPFFALQRAELGIGALIAIALVAALLVPYLFEEIHEGKSELGGGAPTGADVTHRGRRWRWRGWRRSRVR